MPPVSHDCERACGERRGSGQRLPGVRLGQNGEASMGDDPAQTLVHLLGSFADGSDLRCCDRRSGPATLLLHGGRSYNALLLSFTAAAST